MGASGRRGSWLYSKGNLEHVLWSVRGSNANIRNALLTSLGLDSSVGNHNNWPLELGLEVLNHLWSNLLEVVERSEWNSDKDVLGSLSIGLLEFDFLSRVEVDELEVLLEIWGGGLEGLEGLGDFLFEFGGSGL